MFIDELDHVLNVIKTEKECVSRDCNRDCANCDLVLDSDWILSAYNELIYHLTPVKPVEEVNYKFNGYMRLCGNCRRKLRPTSIYCDKCGRPIKKTENENVHRKYR